jgi:hypothetical protein
MLNTMRYDLGRFDWIGGEKIIHIYIYIYIYIYCVIVIIDCYCDKEKGGCFLEKKIKK